MFSAGTKRLLKNFILHTGTHNRIVEENDMWRQHSKTKESNFGESKKNSFLDDNRDDMNDAKYNMKRCSAHMDETNDKTSTYWARQLQKSEEADPERWGHSGFKELYPKDFDSDRSFDDSSSSSSSSSSSDHRRKRKKRKKKLKEMEEKARKRKKKTKKHKQKDMCDSESDSERRKKVKKKRHRKDKFDSDSDSEDNVPRKRLKELSSKRKSKNSSQHKKRSKKHKHKKHSASSD